MLIRVTIDTLCGAFGLWTATSQAEFLQGRFVWAMWDVEEMADPQGEFRQRLEQDPYYLRNSIVGLNGGLKSELP